MAATMDDKTPCRKLINCILTDSFMVLILALYHGFAAVTSTININFSTVDSSILSSSRQHLKEFHYYFQGLLFCAIIAQPVLCEIFLRHEIEKGLGEHTNEGSM